MLAGWTHQKTNAVGGEEVIRPGAVRELLYILFRHSRSYEKVLDVG